MGRVALTAGLDGIPVELWKMLHQQYKSAKEEEQHKHCNITSTLAKILRDIATNGIREGTNFSEGWMCPIYKKKEADNIANYRPIMVLNTDYKILTKAIATLSRHLSTCSQSIPYLSLPIPPHHCYSLSLPSSLLLS